MKQKEELENTYIKVRGEIDEGFEIKKKEILEKHEQDIEKEKKRIQLNEEEEIHNIKIRVRIS